VKYAHGELIDLMWEGDPGDFSVKGHVPPEEFWREMAKNEVTDEWKLSEPRHTYGRWSAEHGIEGCTHALRLYSERGRGRFPVTTADVIGPAQTQSECIEMARRQMLDDPQKGARMTDIDSAITKKENDQ